jgi:hypothetical protein
MKNRFGGSLRKAVGLGVLSAFGLMLLGAVPAFAWTSSVTTTPSATSVVAGTLVTDTATVTLSPDASPFGYVVFAVYSGGCTNGAPTGSQVLTHFTGSVTASNVAVTANGVHSYTSASFSTTGLSGAYVWVVYYTGTGSGGYPRAPLSATTYDCEPFTVNAPHGAPEFPAGLGVLLALALPAMMLLKRRLPTQ